MASILAALHLYAAAVWTHREEVVLGVAAFLLVYYQLPEANRVAFERKYPRWGGFVSLLRRVFPFLPGVPDAAKQIVTGIHPDDASPTASAAGDARDARDAQIANLVRELDALRSPPADSARLLNPDPHAESHAAPPAPAAAPSVPSPPPAEITDAAPPSPPSPPAGAADAPHDSDGSNSAH